MKKREGKKKSCVERRRKEGVTQSFDKEWLIPILANTDLLGFDKERRFGSIEKKKLRVL